MTTANNFHGTNHHSRPQTETQEQYMNGSLSLTSSLSHPNTHLSPPPPTRYHHSLPHSTTPSLLLTIFTYKPPSRQCFHNYPTYLPILNLPIPHTHNILPVITKGPSLPPPPPPSPSLRPSSIPMPTAPLHKKPAITANILTVCPQSISCQPSINQLACPLGKLSLVYQSPDEEHHAAPRRRTDGIADRF